MGFDLHGLSPQGDTPQPVWTKKDPFIKVKGTEHQYEVDPQIKEEYDDYMRTKIDWQDKNEGAYFRNNVWYWRPLWNFVSKACNDILTDKDIESGYMNDGHRISKTKAKRIASRLRKYLRDGYVDSYESWYARSLSKLPEDDWNKNYPFSIQNIRDFERFCEKSGGFEIC
tara:strand:+ start:46 stop:555 length:510 start_codon:yes stop_codon:yes gene_type:complete